MVKVDPNITDLVFRALFSTIFVGLGIEVRIQFRLTGQNVLLGRLGLDFAGAVPVMVPQPPLVAAQPLGQAVRGGVEGGIGLIRLAIGFQVNMPAHMGENHRVIAMSLARQGHPCLDDRAEILAQNALKAGGDMGAQCVPNVELLALHG